MTHVCDKLTDRNPPQATHQQDAGCHGYDIRRLLAAAESVAHGARIQQRCGALALLPSYVSHYACHCDEFNHLQPIPLRLDERQL